MSGFLDWILISFALFILFFAAKGLAAPISIVVTMICRDEAVNLKENLPGFVAIADYFVFLIDDRNTDDSINVISSLINESNYRIVSNKFDGFGSSRTRSLDAAWQYFPQASHVWIADPDWHLDLSTISKSELDFDHDVFGFLSYDRNGFTTRKMHWLLRHRSGLRMRYNLHEVLDIGNYTWKDTNWVIHEIERKGSWHTTVGHGHSMSRKRFSFDLNMLYKDLEEYGHDPHTHSYLGVTHEAYATEVLKEDGLTSEAIEHADKAIFFLKLRVLSEYKDEFLDERRNCMTTLGNIYFVFKVIHL